MQKRMTTWIKRPLYNAKLLMWASLVFANTAAANLLDSELATQPAATLLYSELGGQRLLSWSVNQPALQGSTVVRQELWRSASPYRHDAQLLQTLLPEQQVSSDDSVEPWQQYWYWLLLVDADGRQYWQAAHQPANPTPAESELPTHSMAAGNIQPMAAHPLCKAGAVVQNQSIDCAGITIGSSCNGDSEKQAPVLTLKNASVKNLRLSATGGADGIHCASGNCTLENVVWEDICEDAATNNGNIMTIIGGSAFNSANGPGGKPDKVFQQNAKNSTTVIKGNFTLLGENGKLWRSCGDCSNNGGPRYLNVSGVTIQGKLGSLAGVNRNYKDVATIRAVKVKGYKSGSPKICEEYKGVVKGQGKSDSYGEFWNTAACNVSKSDISGF